MTATELSTRDRYPTRGSVSAEFERQDPTVWGDSDEGPASGEELAAHDEHGFHTVPGLLRPAEVQQYWQELQRLSGQGSIRSDERTIIEPHADEVRSIFDVHKFSDLITGLVHDPRYGSRTSGCDLRRSDLGG